MSYSWENIVDSDSRDYKCGYCGREISSEKGWCGIYSPNMRTTLKKEIRICHKCDNPTFFDNASNQTPKPIFGNEVSHVSDELVRILYKEMRDCMKVSAYTPAVLAARKILMHIAVSKGAEENKKFVYYVDYFIDEGYIVPDLKNLVEHIRKKGNSANHEIVVMKEDDAKELISFVEMLLKLVYEMPHKINLVSDDEQ